MRADSVGGINLTDNNTVTSDTGINSLAAQFTATNTEWLGYADDNSLSFPTALAVEELGHPESTLIAADFTPAPGTLFALAAITPAAGVPRLDLQPSAEVLAMAVTEPSEDPLGALVEVGADASPVPPEKS